ncbi:MAG: molybdenum cofactor guanylyltransferase [Proteobacteria bacterium]|nr:molybdenum cofactor guanylyltransferase [Pseudomonadota bacterium]
MKYPCSGVILAGGQNTRFSGINKAFLRLGDRRILDRIYDVFHGLFQDIIIVTNDPMPYLEWDFNIVTDLFPTRSSLTGIHAGLFFITTPYAFFASCDMPFLNRNLVETVLDGIEPRIDVVIPETAKGLEPLCAVYSKQCLKPVEQQLQKNDLKIYQLLKKVRVKKIPEKKLREHDQDLISFCNINTPEDLVRAEEILAKQLL